MTPPSTTLRRDPLSVQLACKGTSARGACHVFPPARFPKSSQAHATLAHSALRRNTRTKPPSVSLGWVRSHASANSRAALHATASPLCSAMMTHCSGRAAARVAVGGVRMRCGGCQPVWVRPRQAESSFIGNGWVVAGIEEGARLHGAPSTATVVFRQSDSTLQLYHDTLFERRHWTHGLADAPPPRRCRSPRLLAHTLGRQPRAFSPSVSCGPSSPRTAGSWERGG